MCIKRILVQAQIKKVKKNNKDNNFNLNLTCKARTMVTAQCSYLYIVTRHGFIFAVNLALVVKGFWNFPMRKFEKCHQQKVCASFFYGKPKAKKWASTVETAIVYLTPKMS